jgi:hypothetical protein
MMTELQQRQFVYLIASGMAGALIGILAFGHKPAKKGGRLVLMTAVLGLVGGILISKKLQDEQGS